MPKAILLSLLIAMVRYVLATLVLTGMQNWRELDTEAAFATAFSSVGLLVIATIIAAFVVVCVAVIVLRRKQPDAPRTFRLPLMPFIPAFGVLSSLFLISQLEAATWLRFLVWLVIGLVLYFACGRRHSLMNPETGQRTSTTS